MYRHFIKPLLFLFYPEKAHAVTLILLKTLLAVPGASLLFRQNHASVEKFVEVMNLKFPSRVGLAAGFDKNGRHFKVMSALGFGFIEVGTVTPKPQSGNDKPRLFRLPKDRALINRMGFNNEGADRLVERLKTRTQNSGIIIGGNIGKNKTTPNEHAVDDYLTCFRKLFDHVDYFVVNVSSPNTPELRDLQQEQKLDQILSSLQRENQRQQKAKPILLKIAPDLSDEQLRGIGTAVVRNGIEGIIATNTTVERTGLSTSHRSVASIGAGGLSGAPVFEKALRIVTFMRKELPESKVIVGVGGIDTEEKAKMMMEAGADLIQIYTGLIYEGPGLVRRINHTLSSF